MRPDKTEKQGTISASEAFERHLAEADEKLHAATHSPQAALGRALAPEGSRAEKFLLSLSRAQELYRSEGLRSLRRLPTAAAKFFVAQVQALFDEDPYALKLRPEPDRYLVETVRHWLRQERRMRDTAAEYSRSVAVMAESNACRGPNYVPLTSDADIVSQQPAKLIAFYLPQFHRIPENDEWWGRGFTEWTNVSKAVPQFRGHYQPHLPDELGFYDLRVAEVQERQVEVAKAYGIYGFAFYYYWFAGRRLLDAPLDAFVRNPKIDMPFSIMWANENWTRRWDGHEDDVLLAQKHTPETDLQFIQDLSEYIRHPRYIRVNGRPLIMVYRAQLLPHASETVCRWREYCIAQGLGNPYLIAAQTFGMTDPRPLGFDAALQFPPHNEHMSQTLLVHHEHRQGLPGLGKKYNGAVYSYPALIATKKEAPATTGYTLYETAFPMWDNAPRRPGGGTVYAYSTPELYRLWLQRLCVRAAKDSSKAEPLVFLNAWNEWAEGAHLEPDRRYGYGYLQATKDALAYTKRVLQGAAPAADLQLAPDPHIEAQLKGKPKSPVFVYTMGKVGSLSVYEALEALGLEEPIVYAHLLEDLDNLAKSVSASYANPVEALVFVRRGKLIREWMAQADESTRWNVVTMVREPIGQSVAAFFQNLVELIPNVRERVEANDLTAEELYELFLHQFDQTSAALWFDKQFKPVFGVDVFAEPFDFDKGYKTYERGPARAVLIRLEDLSRALQPAMKDFLGIDDFPVISKNVASKKYYAGLLSQFRSKGMPAAYVNRMYSSKYAQHFYTDQERAELSRKWLQGF